VEALSEKYFGKWQHGNYVSNIPQEPQQAETRYTHILKTGFPPYLSLNYKGPAFDDKTMDMPALDVLSSILFPRKSELYKKLVLNETKGSFSYRVVRMILVIQTCSALVLSSKGGRYAICKDEITKTLEAAKTNKPDAQVLADTKSHLKYNFAMSIDNPTSIAESLSHYTWLTGDPESLNRLYALYDKVTVEDMIGWPINIL